MRGNILLLSSIPFYELKAPVGVPVPLRCWLRPGWNADWRFQWKQDCSWPAGCIFAWFSAAENKRDCSFWSSKKIPAFLSWEVQKSLLNWGFRSRLPWSCMWGSAARGSWCHAGVHLSTRRYTSAFMLKWRDGRGPWGQLHPCVLLILHRQALPKALCTR